MVSRRKGHKGWAVWLALILKATSRLCYDPISHLLIPCFLLLFSTVSSVLIVSVVSIIGTIADPPLPALPLFHSHVTSHSSGRSGRMTNEELKKKVGGLSSNV